jgi:hypothetical protein
MPSKECVTEHRRRSFAVYAGGIAVLVVLALAIVLA